MPERPLLRLPLPTVTDPPKGHGGGALPRLPKKDQQRDTYGPLFQRLRSVLSRDRGGLALRDDPTSLAPDRVIVFEIAGTIQDFLTALSRIDGLEFMAEYENDFEADENFSLIDKRKGKEGADRTDKLVPGRLYLAMPDVRALDELVSLWERWVRGEPLAVGLAPFKHLFAQLRNLRPWGPQDRISAETLEYWREESQRRPNEPVRTEVELWYRESPARRQTASQSLRAMVTNVGGAVIHEAAISDIAYHGMLIDIPAGEVQNLIAHPTVGLALADDVMFLRPQSLLLGPLQVEPETGLEAVLAAQFAPPPAGEPIAALLDGVPVQAHALLANRLRLDDPDNLQARAVVAQRVHGTAMASLILHGDRNTPNETLGRPLYVRPLMIVDPQGREHTEADRLLVDTIYRAVVRMKGSEAEQAAAPAVFLVNLSMGDLRRPFSRVMSPLARVLDFLSDRYNLLFLVSGGNVRDPLNIPDFETWTAFEDAEPKDRQKAVIRALHNAKHQRTILSPAEALNAVTIGAQHHDNVANRPNTHLVIDPFEDHTLPNVSSGLGLGHRRMIKPELYFPAGREHVRMETTGAGLRVRVSEPHRLFGLLAAAPDPQRLGRLDQMALSDGTSSATALGTRAGHQIFDALMDREGGSRLAEMDPRFYAVVVKALLSHCARWNGNDELIKEICGPEGQYRHKERSENSSRFIGFGTPEVARSLECTPSRATLVGFSEIAPRGVHLYRIPLPASLERVVEPRSLTVTVAWVSPIKPGHQSYRSINLEVDPMDPMIALGVKRTQSQPHDGAVRRGTISHERFEGKSAVPFIDDGHIVLRVWCKEDAGLTDIRPVRYGIAVTVEAGEAIPVYEEIRQRLRVRPQARP